MGDLVLEIALEDSGFLGDDGVGALLAILVGVLYRELSLISIRHEFSARLELVAPGIEFSGEPPRSANPHSASEGSRLSAHFA